MNSTNYLIMEKVDENGNARKDEDWNYECYSSLDEAKYQATSWVIDLLNKPK
jgi:hypothetical protein